MKDKAFQRIVVATDGSEPAQSAVDVAIAFARASDAGILVAHVWNLEVHHHHGVWDVETRSEATRLIESVVDRFRRLGVEAKGEIIHADSEHVATAVAQTARKFDADLIVVGSRGLSDWQSLLATQSVTHQLLTKVDCPVLVVPGPSSASSHGSKRALLAIAGGDDIKPAVAATIAAASAPGSSVLVLHVAQAIFGTQGFAYVEPEEEIQETLRRATSMLTEAGVTASSMVAPSGPVVRTVIETAASWGADIIVIGSSRVGDLGSILFGSVTHGLLRSSERPVLVAERMS